MRKSAKRRLSVQKLESRHLLAGNIIGNFTGTTLSLGGDAADNQLEVTEVASNQVLVTGLTGTTINGMPSQLFASNLIENVVIRTSSGHDTVFIHDLSLADTPNGNLGVFTSDGNDQIRLKNVTTTQTFQVNAGDHDDRVIGQSLSTNGLFRVDGDWGHDNVSLSWVKAHDIELDLRQGEDNLRVSHAKAINDISINTGSENDTAFLRDIRPENDLNFYSEDGDDQLFTKAVKSGNDVYVDTGDGSDTVFMKNTKANHNVNVSTGQGDDQLTMLNTKAINDVFVHLGSGDDLSAISKVKAHDLYFNAADGTDAVKMSHIHTVDVLGVKMGTGDDVFKIINSSAFHPFFNGGAGTDTLYDLPNVFDEVLASISFEVII